MSQFIQNNRIKYIFYGVLIFLFTSLTVLYFVGGGEDTKFSPSFVQNKEVAMKSKEEIVLIREIIQIEKEKQNQKVEIKHMTTESVDRNDLEVLSKIVHAEAKGEPYEGKVAVAEVVMNRVEDENFPDTVKDVVYQEGQFQPVANGAINNTPSEEAIKASKEVLMSDNTSHNAMYFYNDEIATDDWIRTRKTLFVIGDHTFAK